MIYIKSILVGVVALFSATIVYVVILIAVLMRRYPPPPGAEVSLDLRSVINHEPSFWVVALLAFGLGFLLGVSQGFAVIVRSLFSRARTAPHSRLQPARIAEPIELSNRFKFFSGV